MRQFAPLTQAIVDGDGDKVVELIDTAMANKATLQCVLLDYMFEEPRG